jgi:hypothetical protein
MTYRLRFLVPLLVLSLAACRGRTEEPDTGSGRDVPARDVPVTSDDAPISPDGAQAFADLVRALELATAASAPMADDAMMLRGDLTPTDGEGQDRGAMGFSGGSVVTPSSCAAYSWTGLTASVVLTGCTLESTGTSISGTITIEVSFRPGSFRLSFTSLMVDTSSFDGFVQITSGGTDVRPMPVVDLMLAYSSPMGLGSVSATGLTVSGDSMTGISVSGTLSFTNGGSSTSVVATDVFWAPMECNPSRGTLAVDGAPFPLPATITFLPTTPTTGEVTVSMPPFPDSTLALLPPCT